MSIRIQLYVQIDAMYLRVVQSARSVPSHPLTTPSSHKNYPRFKNIMLKELLGVFNRTVFDNKVCLLTHVQRTACMYNYDCGLSVRTILIEMLCARIKFFLFVVNY